MLTRQHVPSGILNFGGQVLVFGDTTLTIAVADPEQRQRAVASLPLHNASASTTGQSERFVEVDGQRFGHVIDPTTGWPAAAWGSVTVVHQDAMVADILSTALFVLGPARGLQWANDHDVAALFLVPSDTGLDYLPSRRMKCSRLLFE